MEDIKAMDTKPNFRFLFVDEKPNVQTLQVKEEPGISSSTFDHEPSSSSEKQDMSAELKIHQLDEKLVNCERTPVKLEFQDRSQTWEKELLRREDLYPDESKILSGGFLTSEPETSGDVKQEHEDHHQNEKDLPHAMEREDPLCIKALRIKVEADSCFISTERDEEFEGMESSQFKELNEHLLNQALLSRPPQDMTSLTKPKFDSLQNSFQPSQHQTMSQDSQEDFWIDRGIQLDQVSFKSCDKHLSNQRLLSVLQSPQELTSLTRVKSGSLQNSLQPIQHQTKSLDSREDFKVNRGTQLDQVSFDTCSNSTNTCISSSEVSGFEQKTNLSQHFLKHVSLTPFTCEVCDKGFSTKSSLNRHNHVHLPVKQYICGVCYRDFAYKSSFYRHKLLHLSVKPYTCDVCNKGFVQKGHLDQHKIVHLSAIVKPYACEVCNKCFTFKGAWKRHKYKHLSVKPYTCDVCNKGFTRKSYMTQHKSIHLSMSVKPYKCDMCNKGFAWKSILNQHLLQHLSLKPYNCDMCNKVFLWKSILNLHLLKHLSVKPHKCDMCNKGFISKSNLNHHKRLHGPVKKGENQWETS